MNILKNIFTKWRKEDEKGYVCSSSAAGMFLSSTQHKLCKQGKVEGILAHQYVLLQMLVEAGEAEELKDGFFFEEINASSLDEIYRDILQLPSIWKGSFDLEIKGTSSTSSFSLGIDLLEYGAKKVRNYRLEGPMLIIGESQYLLTNPQAMALHAVKKHSELSFPEKTERGNLLTLYTLQQAKEQGLSINLHQFDKLEVENPESIGVCAIENADGSLRLIPTFGPEFSPDEVEKRLGQFGNKDAEALRVGKKLLVLEEKKLEAIHEILSCRVISAKEKRRFLSTPTAYLNAALIDLDVGLSIRVYGAEIFQKAYFGQVENTDLSWFGGQDDADVFMLNETLPLVNTFEDVQNLENQIMVAQQNNKSAITFKDKTILLVDSPERTKEILHSMREHIEQKSCAKTSPQLEPKLSDELITVGIEKNDEEILSDINISHPTYLFQGDLGKSELKYTFLDYQEEGTRWLASFLEPACKFPTEHRYTGALLADDMGLGKTFMVLAALRIYLKLSKKHNTPKPILVVMPVVLLENWCVEVEKVFKQSPFSDIVILQSGADLKKFRQESAGREHRLKTGEEMPTPENWRYSLKVGSNFRTERLDLPGRLVLTNYDTLRDYQFSLCLVDWGCVVFDEAQEIKNPNALKSRAAKGLKADFRLAVTGTPVENSLTDFWSLFDTVTPGLLGAYQDFQKTYMKPVLQVEQLEEKNKLRLELGLALRKQVGKLMLRRTKEEKLSGLPQKVICDGTVDSKYQVCMEGFQLELYDAVVSSVVAAKKSGNSAAVRQVVLPSLRKLNDISLHPDLFGGKSPSPPNGVQNTEEFLHRSAKLKLMLEILTEIRQRNEKVIIFVINKRLQVLLSHCLKILFGVDIAIVNGETKAVATRSRRGTASRVEIIREFEKQDGFGIICMSPLAAGVGLTVTGASNIIHLERHWNPAKEAQATDRVYRIGAKKDVHIYVPVLLHPKLQSFDSNLGVLLSKKIDIKNAVVSVSPVTGDDFDLNTVFGNTFKDERITADWLLAMGWEEFESLVAVLAEKIFNGTSYLTPQSGDLGADVIVTDCDTPVVIQCKNSINVFAESKAVLEPYTAAIEYSQKLGVDFRHKILAINAPSVAGKVLRRAKELDVEVWDREKISSLLVQFNIFFSTVTDKTKNKAR